MGNKQLTVVRRRPKVIATRPHMLLTLRVPENATRRPFVKGSQAFLCPASRNVLVRGSQAQGTGDKGRSQRVSGWQQ